VKLRFDYVVTGMCVAVAVALAVSGCARRAVEETPMPPAPPPLVTTSEVEIPPPVIEEPPVVPPPPDIDPAYFDFDSHRLNPVAMEALDRAAKILRDHPDVTVIIEGHCDERGPAEYNVSLGQRRASAARDYLIAAGVTDDRIDIVSFGEEQPFDDGHNETAWAMNRRAHFVVEQIVLEGLSTTDDPE